MGIQFRVLGPLEVVRDGTPVQPTSAKQRLLLAVLLVHPNEVVRVDTLLEALWGDRAPATATSALQNYVSQLRKSIDAAIPGAEGPRVLLTAERGYRVAVGPDEVDASTFERLLTEGRRALRTERPAAAAELLRKALGLWRGPALADVADEDPVRNEAMRLDELRVLATEDRIAADIALGRHAELVAELEGLVAIHPLREGLWAQLMVCLYRVGRQADALAAFQRLRRRLADELGLDPSPELVRLESAILSQAPSLDWTDPVVRPAPKETTRGSNLPPERDPLLFVGRTTEMADLRDWWRATGSAAGLTLLVGAPGVGKTQLATAFAREVEDDGAQVLYGRAVEAGGSSYEPVLGALRQLVITASDAVVDAFPETSTGALTRLVPEMAERRPVLAAKASAWGEVDRSWLLGAVADCMAGHAGRPTLMVLDDLQWADRPALLLLSHLVEPGRGVRVLATCRTPASTTAGTTYLVDFLSQLRRDDRPARRVELEGLTQNDVRDLVTALAGGELSPAGEGFVSDLHHRTDGHPFFVREMLRHLEDTGAIAAAEDRWTSTRSPPGLDIPEGVLDVVGQRLSHLRPATRDALRVAAVVGTDFDIDVLAAVLDNAQPQVVVAVEEAEASGLLQEDPARVDRYGFVHALVHDVLLGELSRSRRAHLEWRVGEAVEALRPDDLDGWSGELARHFTQGAAVGRAEKVVEWSLRAGEQAMERLAYEEAVRFYESALQARGRPKGAADEERADLLIALGRAANLAGDAERWRASCLEAAALARSAGDGERLARAAITLLGTLAQGTADESVVALLEEAAVALRAAAPTPERDAILAELLARLGGYLTNSRPERSAQLVDGALDTARRAGEKRSLALALIYSTQTHALGQDEHRARLHEAVDLAERAGDREIVLAANSNLMAGALLWADRDEFDRRLAEYARLAEETGAPTPLLLSAIDHAGAAALDGRYDEAREGFREALRRSATLGDPNLRHNIAAGMLPVNRELGGLARWLGDFRRDASDAPASPFRQAGLVRVLCETGELGEATERLESLLAQRDALRSGFLRRYSLVQLAEAAAILGHTDAAVVLSERLRDELRSGTCVIIGPNAYFGAVRRYLGLLASTLGDAVEAVDHHEAALDVHKRMRARGWAARSRYDLGAALSARRRAGDPERAAHLFDEAAGAARRLGMPKLLAELPR